MTEAATKTRRLGVAIAIAALALTASACSKTHRYESVVQIVRKDVVEKDANGVTQQIDYEVEWDACPGDQFQVIRGSQAFAAMIRIAGAPSSPTRRGLTRRVRSARTWRTTASRAASTAAGSRSASS